MKSIAIAVALVTASAMSASATYRLAPNSESDQREQYEFFHTQINQFHPGGARGLVSRPAQKRPVATSPSPRQQTRR